MEKTGAWSLSGHGSTCRYDLGAHGFDKVRDPAVGRVDDVWGFDGTSWGDECVIVFRSGRRCDCRARGVGGDEEAGEVLKKRKVSQKGEMKKKDRDKTHLSGLRRRSLEKREVTNR